MNGCWIAALVVFVVIVIAMIIWVSVSYSRPPPPPPRPQHPMAHPETTTMSLKARIDEASAKGEMATAESLDDALEMIMQPGSVLIFTLTGCMWCMKMKKALEGGSLLGRRAKLLNVDTNLMKAGQDHKFMGFFKNNQDKLKISGVPASLYIHSVNLENKTAKVSMKSGFFEPNDELKVTEFLESEPIEIALP